MISQLEKEVTLRYLKTRKKDGFLNVISIFTFIGISLGVAVLIIVMSVMNGFRSELVEKIVGFNAHVIVKPYENTIDQKIFNNVELRKVSKKLIFSNNGEGVIINKDYTKGILLRGYLKNSFKRLDLVNKSSFIGNKNLNLKHISIGKELSIILNIDIGDKILIMSPSGVQTIIGSLPKQESYVVESIFDSGIVDFDQNVAFINLGGISNITFLINDSLLAYDCSPCCSILNDFIKHKINKEYDKNGSNASKGKANIKIAQQVIKKKFFSLNSPKSLDTYDIKIKDVYKLNIFDGLATLNEFISEAISLSINKFKYKLDKIILLGGGRKNKDLINRIQKKVKIKIFLSEEIGIDGDLIESYAFGYLAIRSLNKDIITFPSTTGVIKPVTGGDVIINKF